MTCADGKGGSCKTRQPKHQINPEISLGTPIAGKVVRTNAVLGSLIDQETEIMTIIDRSMLWGDAEIYERDIAKVKIGQKVAISIPAYSCG